VYRTENDIESLYDASADVRAHAADRLIAAGPTAIPSLVQVVCDKAKPNFDRAWPAAAKALGAMKAEAAAPCLVLLLAYNYPPMGSASLKSDETIAGVDPAFVALLQIGPPAVHALQHELPFLHPEGAYVAIRVLRSIKTPAAREAVDEYIKTLQERIRLANGVLEMWDK
jgi:HEAT repeat protein